MLTLGKLYKGRLEKRYKRFFADVTLESGESVIAHCPNTGTMMTCGAPGDTVYLSFDPSPKRKLSYTWQLSQRLGAYVCVNTNLANKLVWSALENKKISKFDSFDRLQKEVVFQHEQHAASRIDFLLSSSSDPEQSCYLEVKSVTMLASDHLEFPDAISLRAKKHLRALLTIAREGKAQAALLFVANCSDGKFISAAKAVDPEYASLLAEAQIAGVLILGMRNKIEPELGTMTLTEEIPIVL
jgi:sugar fermentation stimulation protein A